MDMKRLLEAVTKFSGEEVGQNPGDQVRGTEKAKATKSGEDHPFKGRLVGASESVLKDLSKGPTPKTKEQELAEQWAAFNEEDLGVHPKRPGRKSDRPNRGHKEQPRYKTIKANEGWNTGNDRVSLPDEPALYWSGKGPLSKEYEALYDKLVPSQGAAETIEGEVLRAASKIVYRHYNDGDEFNEASFDQLEQYIGKVTSYDDLAHKATEYALKANGNYQPNQGWDSLDVMDYGPAAEDEYDDEDEEDYYDDNEEDDLEEAKHFKTTYGWAGGRNEKTGGTYKHPDQIKADREAKKAAKAQQSKDSFDGMFGGGNPAKGLGIREGAEQDPIVAKVVKQMRPGLTGLNMGNEAFLYFAYELGKQRARDAWSDYLPAIRAEYEKGLSEGWESGPEEYEEPYDDADDAYDRQRQEKIDTEAEKAQAKRPQTKIYSLLGRGPNMEPNYKFPGEYNSLDAAVAARKKIMADPKTPYPQHIGISSRTKYLDENSVTPLRDREDYQAKSKTLQDIQMDPDTHKDPQLSSELARRKDILMKQAQALGIDESRAHKVLNTWFKDRERQEKFAKGELTVPTPQERNTKIEKPKKEVKEYGASMSGATGTGSVATSTTAATPPGPGNPNDPEAVKKAAAALTQIKSATNSPAPPAVIAKALDAADQGKQVGSADMKALKPMMDVIKQAAQDPKLAAQFKTLSQQARQAQQK